ncbi:Helitron helicase-like domain-containing protein [Rozella allomycis CSF55]|uniref:Helitron helicase-like domain-containing protein n=1 Tax=Rozella allomycis (strain CSF55) TaxID=988480 RepID=A0A075B0V6_ROZAC|nr:Helitron helicase-like domain-containing protein [Rozella allomycis CSF55]|eukprot:EPZ34574.1 Helitron helicase-like domain-containing protein [Rozella allomycis CSF55]
MLQLYQDAMAIVREFGKLDLFFTVPCNPSSPEIKDNLMLNQTAQDRPDIVARVCNQKLKLIIQDFTKNNIFRKVIAFMYVVEFQKRGLPHAHILLILDEL